ncbi:hypothetical protein SteCoe_38695 [Stentor coeruleus]|uniref:Uncharacterized protein n=1 Tax=Stentor coeruleus TaxID=5963 RepID=A0A1R2AL61_9CILI|nr:hypothetical protein SteCoe_38695 [Stentor coeruleus]
MISDKLSNDLTIVFIEDYVVFKPIFNQSGIAHIEIKSSHSKLTYNFEVEVLEESDYMLNIIKVEPLTITTKESFLVQVEVYEKNALVQECYILPIDLIVIDANEFKVGDTTCENGIISISNNFITSPGTFVIEVKYEIAESTYNQVITVLNTIENLKMNIEKLPIYKNFEFNIVFEIFWKSNNLARNPLEINITSNELIGQDKIITELDTVKLTFVIMKLGSFTVNAITNASDIEYSLTLSVEEYSYEILLINVLSLIPKLSSDKFSVSASLSSTSNAYSNIICNLKLIQLGEVSGTVLLNSQSSLTNNLVSFSLVQILSSGNFLLSLQCGNFTQGVYSEKLNITNSIKSLSIDTRSEVTANVTLPIMITIYGDDDYPYKSLVTVSITADDLHGDVLKFTEKGNIFFYTYFKYSGSKLIIAQVVGSNISKSYAIVVIGYGEIIASIEDIYPIVRIIQPSLSKDVFNVTVGLFNDDGYKTERIIGGIFDVYLELQGQGNVSGLIIEGNTVVKSESGKAHFIGLRILSYGYFYLKSHFESSTSILSRALLITNFIKNITLIFSDNNPKLVFNDFIATTQAFGNDNNIFYRYYNCSIYAEGIAIYNTYEYKGNWNHYLIGKSSGEKILTSWTYNDGKVFDSLNFTMLKNPLAKIFYDIGDIYDLYPQPSLSSDRFSIYTVPIINGYRDNSHFFNLSFHLIPVSESSIQNVKHLGDCFDDSTCYFWVYGIKSIGDFRIKISNPELNDEYTYILNITNLVIDIQLSFEQSSAKVNESFPITIHIVSEDHGPYVKLNNVTLSSKSLEKNITVPCRSGRVTIDAYFIEQGDAIVTVKSTHFKESRTFIIPVIDPSNTSHQYLTINPIVTSI